ncbi:saccharopine dehydrogenase NADP-binding domain-containing protein [Streptomyces shenzhenensis]|uniref:saccharopine dehydrogenase NADP-binding domain-containing protein n=1 Tax=Streptomyces shenzhenensis TaxID=943815 RepID=UPI0015F0747B|nr:saccharopine dehydrogenase NADP-binding domain-containing protein [Streptomyces shenzhenensis]
MTKIVILGGAGEVGQWVARDLVARPSITEVVIAEVSIDRARTLATELGPKARVVDVDMWQRGPLLEELRGAALLMNCTSHVFFDQVFELALEARVNYADLISEPSPQQRAATVQAGITAVSGLGISPGVTQVLARHAVDEFDQVDEIHVSGVSWRTIAPSRGGLETVLWELADRTPTRQYFQNGRFRGAAYLEGSRWVDFPEPVGRHRVYYVPHPETTSLVRSFPQLKFCATRVSWRDEIMEDVRVLNKYGLLDDAEVEGAGGKTIREAVRDRMWEVRGGERDDRGWALMCTVEVVGLRDGHSVVRTYQTGHPEWGHDTTGRVTGVSAAVGAELLAVQPPKLTGWIDPELAFEPGPFLAALEERGCIPIVQSETLLDGQALQRPTA